MDKKELAKHIYKQSYITGKFRLRSGQISNEYFDKYQFESNPELLFAIAKHLKSMLPEKFDYLGALEMGGIPLATALSLETGKPVVFIRKEAKQYGTAKFAEGPSIRNKKLVLIEDVVTSGGQLILSTNDLRKHGALIEHALCVVDREAGGSEKLAAEGIKLLPLFTMSAIKEATGKE